MATPRKPRATLTERKAQLLAELKALEKKEAEKARKEKAAATATERKLRTRQSIIVGASLIALAESDAAARKVLASILVKVEREQDKKTVQPLVEKLKADKAN